MGVNERVEELVEPVVSGMSLELVDVEFAGGILRITVDDPSGSVTSGALVDLNRAISPLLDLEDPVPGRYTLEVSSPGLVRKLRTPAHFSRAQGETVVLKLIAGSDPRRVKGTLLGATDTDCEIEATEIDGSDLTVSETMTIAYDELETATTHFEWGPKPKPKGGGSKPKSAPRSTV